MRRSGKSGKRQGDEQRALAILLGSLPSPWPRDYRRWYELTEDLLWSPALPFDGWLEIRDAHAQLGRLIRRRARGHS